MVKGFFVAALAGQGVVDIGQRHGLGTDGDVVALQPVGVAAAVVALVVPVADLTRGFDQRRVLLERQLVQNLITDGGVGLHDLELFLRELAGLVQDGFGDVDLADVVQGGRHGDEADLRLGQRVLVGHRDELAQDHLGEGADVQHVHAALAIAELDNMAEDGNHQRVGFFVFVDLVGHQLHQALLLAVQHQGVDHTAAHHRHIKGAADIVGRAQIVGALYERGGVFGRDHDDRQFVDPVILIHGSQHIEAVFYRHHDVQQQQINAAVFLDHFDGLLSVFCFQDLVFLAQHFGKDGAVHL